MLEALPEGGDGVSETAEADMGGAGAAVALSPVGGGGAYAAGWIGRRRS